MNEKEFGIFVIMTMMLVMAVAVAIWTYFDTKKFEKSLQQ